MALTTHCVGVRSCKDRGARKRILAGPGARKLAIIQRRSRPEARWILLRRRKATIAKVGPLFGEELFLRQNRFSTAARAHAVTMRAAVIFSLGSRSVSFAERLRVEVDSVQRETLLRVFPIDFLSRVRTPRRRCDSSIRFRFRSRGQSSDSQTQVPPTYRTGLFFKSVFSPAAF